MALTSGSYCTVDCSLGAEICPEGTACNLLDGGLKQCVPLAGDCVCEDEAFARCYQGDLVSFDSCEEPGELLEDCGDLGCAGGACCELGTHPDGDACVPDEQPDSPVEPQPEAEETPEALEPLPESSVEPLPEPDEEVVEEVSSPEEVFETTEDAASPDVKDVADSQDDTPGDLASTPDTAVPDTSGGETDDPSTGGSGGGSGGCSVDAARPGSPSSLWLVFLLVLGLGSRRQRTQRTPL